MAIISLNDRRTSLQPTRTTGKEVSYFTSAQFKEADPNPVFGGVTNGLYVHWDIGNSNSYGGSGTTITDLMGNGHNGTIKNPDNMSYTALTASEPAHLTLSTSVTEDSAFIHRSTDYFDSIGTGDFTLEYWVNIYLRSGGNGMAIRNVANQASPYDENFTIYLHSNGRFVGSPWLNATASTSAGYWFYIDPYSTTAPYVSNSYNGWNHLVWSRIGTGTNNMYFYRNNSLVYNWTNKAQYNDACNETGEARSAWGGDSASDKLRGKFTIYRFYMYKGLTAANVSTNYNDEKSRFGL